MTACIPVETALAAADGGVHRLARTELAAEPFFLMAQLASAGSAAANNELAHLDLKVRHYSVLALACSGADPTQRELSQFLVLDPSRIVAIVDDLERRGAVLRRTDPGDRRTKTIEPTPAGRELFDQAKKSVSQATAGSLAVLTAEEQEQLRRLLQKAIG